MQKRPLLIATTNQGKFLEIKNFLNDLPFEFFSLRTIEKNIPEANENGSTIEENSLIKAKYYGEKSGLLSLSDDSGLFVEELHGWPGVNSSQVAPESEKLVSAVLKKMVSIKNRKAVFRCVMCAFDPDTGSYFMSRGKTDGNILENAIESRSDFVQYDSIFFLPELGKTFAEMSTVEKNSVSHRGKALTKIKYYLMNQYGSKHVVVPVGLIIKNGKIMATLRNDPHRPEFHRKWEFPGGTMEFGEQIADNIVRELKEETGYDVEVLKLLQNIQVRWVKDLGYQIYLLPYVCKIVGGDGKYSDAEILDLQFFDLDNFAKQDLIGQNKKMYLGLLPELKEAIKHYNL